jgi:hypothetical protein
VADSWIGYMKCTELPHPSKGSLGGAPGQLNKPFIEIYFVFSDSDDEMHGRSLPGCPTHSRFSNEWVPRVTASGTSHHRRKDLIPILSRYDERFGALVWWARSALHNL